MQIKQITQVLEDFAPPALQESYDNAGLIIGNHTDEVSGALITIDITEAVIDEAIQLGFNLIISHHPIVMSGIKRFNGNNYVEKCIIKCIQNNIAVYSCHTNADSVVTGVNGKICEKLGLVNCRILDSKKNVLLKLVTFVPVEHAENVRTEIFKAGAGHIGNYDSCSFNVEGSGTFKANEGANPFVGAVGQLHVEKEVRVETIFPDFLKSKVINALLVSHPYEEVAYDLYPLNNEWNETGSGMYGELKVAEDEINFLKKVKEIFGCGSIRYTNLLNKKIKKVAVCGGSGSFLLGKAKAVGADIFITGDFKYHQFFDAENKIVIADIGHFESEQFTKEVFFEILTKKIPNFAVRLSNVNTNPIKYL